MFYKKNIGIKIKYLGIITCLALLQYIFLYSQKSSKSLSNLSNNVLGHYEIIGEQIVIIENFGTNYISFLTIRTPFNNTAWSLDKNVKLKEFLDNFLYINPIDYTWDKKSSPLYNYFTFSRGSYGTIIRGNFKQGVSVKNNETLRIKNGVYSYKNEDGVKELSGSYGFSYEKYGFSQLTYAWILPQNWEFVEYSSESKGKWNIRNNTLIFIGKNINNVVFNISYQKKKSKIISKMKKSLGWEKNKDIKIQEVDNGLKLVFSDKIFFAPGKASLSRSGKKILDKVADLMKKNSKFNLQIHGHTDNVKVKNIKEKISDNWELSVFRSLSILNYLTKKKSISGKRFEVRGYGKYKPIASNSTKQGRSKNRRIELFLTEFK